LKKRSKKLLLVGGSVSGGAKARSKQKFFGSFFQKRTACFLLACALTGLIRSGIENVFNCE
jgi:hypothetical protein